MFDEVCEKIEKLLRLAVMVMLVLFLTVGICTLARAESYTCVVHRGEWVWVRETPSRDGRKIGRVRYGYEVESDAPVNGFLAIDLKPGWMLDGEHGARGYVDASYFDKPIKETMYRVNTEAGPLAKRETPDGRLMCWIKPGVKISVLAWRYAKDGELWAKVYHGGYVKASFLAEQ